MQINGSVLKLDIKVQDKLREMLANLNNGVASVSGVMLGDSDIDYNLLDMTQARILNAPFNVNKVKYPLVFKGSGKGLEGTITCYARMVNIVNEVYSVYDYPTNLIFRSGTNGQSPPPLSTGYDWYSLNFLDVNQGYILFFQTLLLNYYDPITNQQLRFNEPLDIEVTFNGSKVIPQGWEVTIDNGTRIMTPNNITVYNNSMLIAKDWLAVSHNGTNNGVISVTGKYSNINKKIVFNI